MTKAEQIQANPGFPWLSIDDAAGLEAYLHARGWLAADERVLACEKPGEGNMNLTLRVTTGRRSLIVKQARPWVEKYDHIPAPWDRADHERRFYERVANIPGVASAMPRLLAADPQARTLLLEDLAGARSLASLYAGDSLSHDESRELGRYLRLLHEATRGPANPNFANRAMRALNHHHIFEFPLAEHNGLDLEQLEPGLGAAAARLRADRDYRALVAQTGRRYLADGGCLVHGDFFPGSWLRTPHGIRVIDPEFCCYGDAEVDLGCALAHLALAAQPRESAATFLQAYHGAAGNVDLQSTLLASYAAAEVMRRLIGLAQLPLAAAGISRAGLLVRSRRAMIQQSWEALWS